MKTASKKSIVKDMPGRFDELVRMLPPRVIHDEAEYDEVIAVIDRVLARPKRTKGQDDYVATWSILIDEYEEQHHAIDTSKVSGIDSLRRLMDDHRMSASDLGRLLGNVSIGSKILRGERGMSKSHLRTLADHFRVDPSLFF